MKKKIEQEYMIKSSPKVLFSRLSTPGGLTEWFADDVTVKGSIYTFIWDGSEERAEMISKKENRHIRFKWLEDEDGNYFEFRIEVHELTGELALIITDFVEADEEADIIDLWDNQVEDLKHAIGI